MTTHTKKELLKQAKLCRRLDRRAEHLSEIFADAQNQHAAAESAYDEAIEKMQRMGGKTPNRVSCAPCASSIAPSWDEIIKDLGGE